MSGTKISEMTVTASLPDGTYVPLVVTDPITGLNPQANYRYNLGGKFLLYTTTSAFALNTGASLIGTDNGDSVQQNLDVLLEFKGDIESSTGSGFVGFLQSGTGAEPRTVQDKLREPPVSIQDYRAAGATSDTAAFMEAVATGRPVYLPGGKGAGPSGRYLITNFPTSLPAGTKVFGDGIGKTIVRPVAAGSSVFYQESANDSTQDDGLSFSDMTLYGYVETAGFSEQVPLMSLNGVSNTLIERVEFKGFQGDGLTLAAGLDATDARLNSNVTVRDCIFNGIIKENRNAISVLSMDGMLVDHCWFTTLSKSTMPGAIDFEPNTGSETAIDNITIQDCTFNDIGGAVGAIAIIIPSDSPVATNIKIVDNTFRNNDSADIAMGMGRTVSVTETDSAILIDGNYGSGGYRPADIFAVRGVRITGGNTFENYLLPIQIGFNTTLSRARDIYCAAQLVLVGTAGGTQPGLLLGYASIVTLDGMLFDRCSGTASGDAAIQLLNSSTSESVTISNTRFIVNGSQTKAIANQGTHVLTAPSNRTLNNNFGALTSDFLAATQTGTATLVAGAVTVTAPGVSASSLVFVNRYTDGGTASASYSITRSNGVSFTVTGKDGAGANQTADTSVVAYSMLPA